MKEFYTAGGAITAPQNALAIAGDYLSAASFLGAVGVFFTLGSDGLLYAVGAVACWPIATFLVGERLRNLGRYTFSDALGYRLQRITVRGAGHDDREFVAAQTSDEVIVAYDLT